MIDSLYYGGKPCACCSGSPRNDLSEAIFSADILEDFLRKIYDGFDVSREIEPSAWREVLRILNEGAVKGLTQGGERQHTPQFLQAIKHSNEVFSAFKCHSMGVKMAERLHDKDGNLRPFKEWREAVQPIASHHVGAWLKTEYDTAVLRAHQGSLWQEFERNKDILPNLRWMPTTSVSPENVHKGYWTSRLTLPVDDPFWQDNHPANRWNCKCSLEATSDKADTGHVAEMARQDNTSQQGLENNPRDGHLFSDKHPYFPKNCASCPFKKQSKLQNWIGRLFNSGEGKDDCYNCPYIDESIDQAKLKELIEERRQLYLKYKGDPEYKDVEFNEKTGGVKAMHKEHNLDDKKGFYELNAQNAGYNNGHSVILDKEDHSILNQKNVEGLWDGLKFEIAGAESSKENNIRNALKHCAKKEGAEIAVLYFPNEFDLQGFYGGLAKYNGLKGTTQYKEFKKIYLVTHNDSGLELRRIK